MVFVIEHNGKQITINRLLSWKEVRTGKQILRPINFDFSERYASAQTVQEKESVMAELVANEDREYDYVEMALRNCLQMTDTDLQTNSFIDLILIFNKLWTSSVTVPAPLEKS